MYDCIITLTHSCSREIFQRCLSRKKTSILVWSLPCFPPGVCSRCGDASGWWLCGYMQVGRNGTVAQSMYMYTGVPVQYHVLYQLTYEMMVVDKTAKLRWWVNGEPLPKTKLQFVSLTTYTIHNTLSTHDVVILCKCTLSLASTWSCRIFWFAILKSDWSQCYNITTS